MDLRTLDEIATAATASPIEDDVHGWWCKAAPGLPFRRCNVALPSNDAGLDRTEFDTALAAVRQWYRSLGQRLIIQVSSASPHQERLDHWLADEGLVVEAPVDVLVRTNTARSQPAGATVAVTAGIDEPWATAYGRIHGGGSTQEARTEAYGRMLEAFGERALGASASDGDRVVGVGFGVLDRGWLGIFGMGTAPSHRRQGIATAVVDALVAAAAERGTQQAYLQVETDNDGAITLYRRLGFERSHGYHYRSEGADPEQGC